jgi:DNA polymerase-4
MASAHALRLCPDLVMLRPDFDKYRRVSRQIHAIFQRYTEQIEPLSLDEAYLDVTETEAHGNSATRIADAIREQCRRDLDIVVSAGVAPNKFLAKVASDWDKPDGRYVIPPSKVEAFVRQLPVERIAGVGRVTAQKLRENHVRTCGDLQQISRVELAQWFGVFGERLYHFSRGEDDRPVKSEHRRKSVSVEKTYSTDLERPEDWHRELPELLDKLRERLERLDSRYLIQALIAKVRYRDFVLSTCESAGQRIQEDAYRELLDTLWQRREMPARLLGIGVRLRDTSLPWQPDLFPDEQEKALSRQREKDL